MLCLAAGTEAARIAVVAFTLVWSHSVEKVEWQEDWRIESGRLVLEESRVKGSGAGMEPGPGAVLEGGFWRWQPDLAPVAELVLARSGATGGDWSLCVGEDCRSLGRLLGPEAGGPARMQPCDSVQAGAR
ncbi:MAG TPA: DUF1850 domain-containing protein [Geminicoccaceae bacterium]|nr:DUF1850 domain-containing protein [Geminicoccaceae bacterium]